MRSTGNSGPPASIVAITMAGILLVAALLRFQQIDQPYVDAFGWRESDTGSMADAFARGNWNIFLPQVRFEGPGPNYIGAEFQLVSYLAALGYQVFGAAPWVGRTISVIFSLWGIVALYLLVRRVWDPQRGIAAAAVMAVLPGSVFTERSFLPDGPMTALMTTSLWLLVRYCETERRRDIVGAAFFGILGCLTKLPGGILVIPAVYAVVSSFGGRLRERNVRASLGIAAIAVALPVSAYYLWARHLALSTALQHFAGGDKFLWHDGIAAWLARDYYVPGLWDAVFTLWTVPFMVLAVVGSLLPLRGQSGKARWIFHAWAAALVIRYLIEAKHLVADPYNLHLYNPVIAVFAGNALVALATYPFSRTTYPLSRRARAPQTALAVIAFCGAAAYGYIGSQFLYLESYRDHFVLGKIVGELSRPDELVVSMGLEPIALYYSRRNGWVFPPFATTHRSGWIYDSRDGAALRELEAQGASWLVIPSRNSYAPASDRSEFRDWYPVLDAAITNDFDLVREVPEGLVFRVKSAARG